MRSHPASSPPRDCTRTRTPPAGLTHDEEVELVSSGQTIKRPERPEDVAGAVAFLCSADAEFVTGQILYVDGGITRTRQHQERGDGMDFDVVVVGSGRTDSPLPLTCNRR